MVARVSDGAIELVRDTPKGEPPDHAGPRVVWRTDDGGVLHWWAR